MLLHKEGNDKWRKHLRWERPSHTYEVIINEHVDWRWKDLTDFKDTCFSQTKERVLPNQNKLNCETKVIRVSSKSEMGFNGCGTGFSVLDVWVV